MYVYCVTKQRVFHSASLFLKKYRLKGRYKDETMLMKVVLYSFDVEVLGEVPKNHERLQMMQLVIM